MGKMRNAAIARCKTVVEFEQPIANHEIFRLNREKEVQVNHLVREGHAKGEQYAEYCTRCPDHRRVEQSI